ncbi:MAG TPA: thiamine phosphate synthase [Tissierellales bacterium]|nr:thiamine phosphate synthase [Tissierellales bacterium]
MKLSRKDMLLYLVTDRTWLKDETLPGIVESILKNKATFIQLREKNLDYNNFKELAIKVKRVTDKYKVPFVINDNIHIAMEVDADGVHIGQSDLVATRARKALGKNKILGVSVSNVEQAIEAEKAGADYLGVGSVFITTSKLDATNVEMEEIKKITKTVNIPVIGIGGINKENIHLLKGSGLDGIAVISAILAQKDVERATRNLYKLSKGVFSESSNI